MELVDGVTLRALLHRPRSTEPEAALASSRDRCSGSPPPTHLVVVHRDYKPDNVLVDQAGAEQARRLRHRDPVRPGGRVAGHPGLHGARAVERGAGQPGQRHLRRDRHVLRVPHRRAAVRRRRRGHAAPPTRACSRPHRGQSLHRRVTWSGRASRRIPATARRTRLSCSLSSMRPPALRTGRTGRIVAGASLPAAYRCWRCCCHLGRGPAEEARSPRPCWAAHRGRCSAGILRPRSSRKHWRDGCHQR